MRSSLAAVLFLSAVARASSAQDISWTSTASGSVGWESNVSNSDRGADAVSSFTLGSRVDSFGRKTLAGDNAIVFGAEGDFRAVWDEARLDEFMLRPSASVEHKFGLGAYAPIAALRITALGRLGRDSDRSGTGQTSAIILRQRFTPYLRLESFYEDSKFDAHADVFAARSREISTLVAYDVSDHWQIAAEGRYRQGDVVSFAVPPRPDLRPFARDIVNSEFFSGRTAYSIEAHTLAGALAATYRATSGFLYSFRTEYRDTERKPIAYQNLNLSFSLSRVF